MYTSAQKLSNCFKSEQHAKNRKLLLYQLDHNITLLEIRGFFQKIYPYTKLLKIPSYNYMIVESLNITQIKRIESEFPMDMHIYTLCPSYM